MAKPQYSGIWTALRLIILARDGYRCQLNLKGCTRTATAVDHINGWQQGHHPSNLQAACQHCNSAKAAHQTNHTRTRQTPQPSRQW